MTPNEDRTEAATSRTVGDLMTSPPLTIRRSSALDVATRRMERHHVHRLVVVADDDPTLPIGVITTTDLVHALAQDTQSAPS